MLVFGFLCSFMLCWSLHAMAFLCSLKLFKGGKYPPSRTKETRGTTLPNSVLYSVSSGFGAITSSNYMMFYSGSYRPRSSRIQDDLEEPQLRQPSKNDASKFLSRKELFRVFSEDYEVVDRLILDPRGSFISTWNKVFFAACLTSLFIDPLFFLLPQATKDVCISVSLPLEISFTAIRSIADVFYVINIFFGFRTAYLAPSSRVLGRGELIVDPSRIASRYLRNKLWLDILAALPIPQTLTWAVIPHINGSMMIGIRQFARISIIFQYILRLYLVFPLATRINNASGVVLETAWAGAAYNLLLYLLSSHVFGCLWYLLAIERQQDCWREVCSLVHEECYYILLDCRYVDDVTRKTWTTMSNVSTLCNPDSGFFQFGIYGDALTFGVTSSGFFHRFFYCLWWALRNLNSLGQELATSTYLGEINYAMIFGIVSLVLFGLLIGNVQMYLQSSNGRLEQWRLFKTDAEAWMHHRHLPHQLKQKVRRHNQHKWCATRGVDEDAILKSLPTDLRRDIKRHLCLDLVRKVPLFDMMDEQVLDAICDKLKPFLYDQGTCLVHEGEPVYDMIFLIRGRVNSYTTDGGRADFFNSCLVVSGGFCGEELLTWALDPRSGAILPSSTRTVIAITKIEGFAFAAEDLKSVTSQYRRLNSKQLRHVFRFHSPQWRTWAACFIQAAWFRYKRLKIAKKKESDDDSVKPKLAIYAVKLAASTRRGGPKPEDPDFTSEQRL